MWAGPAPRGREKEVARPQAEPAAERLATSALCTANTPNANHGPRRESIQPLTPTQGPLLPPDPDQPASPSHTRAAPALQSTGEAYLACSTGTPYATPPTVPNLPHPTLMGTTTSVNCDPQNLLSPRAKTSLTKTAALKVTSGSPNSDPQRRCSVEAAPKPGAPQPQTLPTHPSSCRPSQAKRPLGWAGAGAYVHHQNKWGFLVHCGPSPERPKTQRKKRKTALGATPG